MRSLLNWEENKVLVIFRENSDYVKFKLRVKRMKVHIEYLLSVICECSKFWIDNFLILRTWLAGAIKQPTIPWAESRNL